MERASRVPNLIRCVYHFQYNTPRAILEVIHAGVGFRSGTQNTSRDHSCCGIDELLDPPYVSCFYGDDSHAI